MEKQNTTRAIYPTKLLLIDLRQPVSTVHTGTRLDLREQQPMMLSLAPKRWTGFNRTSPHIREIIFPSKARRCTTLSTNLIKLKFRGVKSV